MVSGLWATVHDRPEATDPALLQPVCRPRRRNGGRAVTSAEYKEIGDELDSLMRVYRDQFNSDERLRRRLQEALDIARTRHADLVQEGR